MAKLDPARGVPGPLVQGFATGGFRIDGEVHAAALLTPLWVKQWTAVDPKALDREALADLLTLTPPPEFILLGTGATLVRPPAALVAAMEADGIGVEAMDSRAAARAWGVLRAEGRWIGAALMRIATAPDRHPSIG